MTAFSEIKPGATWWLNPPVRMVGDFSELGRENSPFGRRHYHSKMDTLGENSQKHAPDRKQLLASLLWGGLAKAVSGGTTELFRPL